MVVNASALRSVSSLTLLSCAGGSSAIIRNSSRRSGSGILKGGDGAASTITPRFALPPTDSWSPSGRLFPPQESATTFFQEFTVPEGYRPEDPPLRPERHSRTQLQRCDRDWRPRSPQHCHVAMSPPQSQLGTDIEVCDTVRLGDILIRGAVSLHGRNPKVSAFIGLPLNVCVRFRFTGGADSPSVLLVGDVLQPIDHLAVKHPPGWRCASWPWWARHVPWFSPGGNQTTSPGWTSSTGPPCRWVRCRP